MKFMSEPTRWRLEDFLYRAFKPEVSRPRQLVALVLFALALGLSFAIFGRISYAYCHLLAGMGLFWLSYTCSGSMLAGVYFTLIASIYNEFVIDLAKPDHPNLDWDQLIAGFIGIAVGYGVLAALRRVWPGREWTKKPRVLSAAARAV